MYNADLDICTFLYSQLLLVRMFCQEFTVYVQNTYDVIEHIQVLVLNLVLLYVLIPVNRKDPFLWNNPSSDNVSNLDSSFEPTRLRLRKDTGRDFRHNRGYTVNMLDVWKGRNPKVSKTEALVFHSPHFFVKEPRTDHNQYSHLQTQVRHDTGPSVTRQSTETTPICTIPSREISWPGLVLGGPDEDSRHEDVSEILCLSVLESETSLEPPVGRSGGASIV